MTVTRTKQEEVDRNFEFFQRQLRQLLPDHAGKFALIRDCQIIDFFDTAQDANTAGARLYSDGLFSIWGQHNGRHLFCAVAILLPNFSPQDQFKKSLRKLGTWGSIHMPCWLGPDVACYCAH